MHLPELPKMLWGIARGVWAASPPALLVWLYALLRQQRLEAEQVTAWAGDHVDDCEFVQRFREREGWQPYHSHTLLIRNGGKHPVRSVTVRLPDVDGAIESESREAYYCVGDVPPDTTRTVPLDCDLHYHESNLAMFDLYFVLGRKRWYRRADGRLRRRRDWTGWAARAAYRLRERFARPELEPDGQPE
ncbi:hypothetical protein [Streptomyces sp. NPDC002078]